MTNGWTLNTAEAQAKKPIVLRPGSSPAQQQRQKWLQRPIRTTVGSKSTTERSVGIPDNNLAIVRYRNSDRKFLVLKSYTVQKAEHLASTRAQAARAGGVSAYTERLSKAWATRIAKYGPSGGRGRDGHTSHGRDGHTSHGRDGRRRSI